MKRLWLVGLWVIAALALSAAGPSIATAHYWMVNGKKLAAGKSNGKEVELVSNSPIIFTIKSPSYQVECETLQFTKERGPGVIWNETKGTEVVGRDEGRMEATKCTDLSAPTCTVVEPISDDNTSEISTTLVEDKTNKRIYDMFVPEQWVEGTAAESEKEHLFWTWDQIGTGCLTNVPIEGDGLASRTPKETEELETHSIELPGEASNCHPVGAPISSVIMANGNTVTLRFRGDHVIAQECGEATARLLSKETWSVK
jgi:hypothetical protein